MIMGVMDTVEEMSFAHTYAGDTVALFCESDVRWFVVWASPGHAPQLDAFTDRERAVDAFSGTLDMWDRTETLATYTGEMNWRHKGSSPGHCYTPGCDGRSRWIPIADPPLIPGDSRQRYRCVECCDAIGTIADATLGDAKPGTDRYEAFRTVMVTALQCTRGQLMAQVAKVKTQAS